MNIKLSGFLSLFLVGVLFGLSGPLAKLLSDSFSAYEAVFVRFLIAFGFIIVFSYFSKNKITYTGVPKKVLFMFSATFPLSVLLFVLSVFNTKVALAVFTYYIADALTSYIIGYFKLSEKLDTPKIIGLILILLSLVFFSNLPDNFSVDTGMIFGLLSGFINSIASYFKKIIKGKASVVNLTILQTFTGALVAAVAVIISGEVFTRTIPAGDIAISFVYGIVFLAITYLMIHGFQNFNLNLGSIVVSSELIFGPLFAVLILGEGLTTWEIVGGILVIAAIVISNIDSIQKYWPRNSLETS